MSQGLPARLPEDRNSHALLHHTKDEHTTTQAKCMNYTTLNYTAIIYCMLGTAPRYINVLGESRYSSTRS